MITLYQQEHLRNDLAKGTAALLIDVRTQEEYERGTIANAINIPHTVIGDRILEEAPDKSTEIILFCRTGARTQLAYYTLQELGYTNAYCLEDGYERWAQESTEENEQ